MIATLAAIYLTGVIILSILFALAPEGWEDADGYHDGRPANFIFDADGAVIGVRPAANFDPLSHSTLTSPEAQHNHVR
jgi:hypothetical protein